MKKARILIVEDDYDFADSLSELIENQGHDVEVVYSGEQAVAKFREQDFDITLMDMKLPGMNGVESFLEFRNIKPEAKVIMMTGYSVEELVRQVLNEGALEVFTKPLNMTKLLHSIDKANAADKIDILLVDDDEDFINSSKDFLHDEGYSVAVARNGQEAIEKIQTIDVSALLLDLRMPVMTGLEVYTELKKSKLLVPTIIMTAYRVEEAGSIDLLQSMNSLGYLFKPFEPTEMLALIKAIMQENTS